MPWILVYMLAELGHDKSFETWSLVGGPKSMNDTPAKEIKESLIGS